MVQSVGRLSQLWCIYYIAGHNRGKSYLLVLFFSKCYLEHFLICGELAVISPAVSLAKILYSYISQYAVNLCYNLPIWCD